MAAKLATKQSRDWPAGWFHLRRVSGENGLVPYFPAFVPLN
jgi:hypothetical protein